VLGQVANGGNILADGASLIVIYQLPGAQFKTVMLSDGNLSLPIGTNTGTTSFSGFTTTTPLSAMTTFVVGDGQFGGTPVSFTGSLGTLKIPNVFTSAEGSYWDTDTFSVSSVLGTGSSTDSATITVSADCLLWSAQAFSVTTALIPPEAVTTIAAVVQANADGTTVINGRGLAPTDAPKLQEQILMIVQSEIIQNPSISVKQLITELVDSLPPSILPPNQASEIIDWVSKNVVLPKKPASPANLVVTRELTRGNGDVIVHLTITNTGGTAAAKVALASVTLGSNSASPVPQTIGTIAAAAFMHVTLTVPGFVGSPGVATSLKVSGTYMGGTFTATSRVTLP
jgi:hypothetical protein